MENLKYRTIASRLLDLKLRTKILLLISPVMLFWFLAILNTIIYAVTTNYEYHFFNELLNAIIVALILMPLIFALPIFIVTHKNKHSVAHLIFILVIAMSYLAAAIVVAIFNIWALAMTAQVLFGAAMQGTVYDNAIGVAFAIAGTIAFAVYYFAIVAYFIVDAVRRMKMTTAVDEE